MGYHGGVAAAATTAASAAATTLAAAAAAAASPAPAVAASYQALAAEATAASSLGSWSCLQWALAEMDGADSCQAAGPANNLSMNAIPETLVSFYIVITTEYYQILQITT